MTEKNRILSSYILWTRSLTISLSIFMIGYGLGVVNTLDAKFIKLFKWDSEEISLNLLIF